MKRTPIYGMPYIEGQDLVSEAPANFEEMATGFEAALNQVDRRQTPQGVKPQLAATITALTQILGVVGQTGYVTNDSDPSNNGPYVYTGSAWTRYVTHNDIEALRFRQVRTNALGAYSWQWAHAHDRGPDAITVTQCTIGNDAADCTVHPILWSDDAHEGQIRMWRADNLQWTGDATVSFDVIAVWL